MNIYKIINPLKNALQYSVGSILYFLFFGEFNLTTFAIGMIGFLIAYESVYFFNDTMDYEDDRKNSFKKRVKALTVGNFKKDSLISSSYILAAIGLAISFFVNKFFGFIIIALFVLNFLHSSNFTRWKKTRLVTLNMFLIEFIKFSLGWFIFTSSLAQYPIFLFALLSMLYVLGYTYYKQGVMHFLNKKIIAMGLISLAFYGLSMILYPFRLALLLPLPVVFTFFIFRKTNDSFKRLIIGSGLVQILAFAFILSLILMTVPIIDTANKQLSVPFDCLKNNITENMPDKWANISEQINKTDMGNYVNCNITNITITK